MHFYSIIYAEWADEEGILDYCKEMEVDDEVDHCWWMFKSSYFHYCKTINEMLNPSKILKQASSKIFEKIEDITNDDELYDTPSN